MHIELTIPWGWVLLFFALSVVSLWLRFWNLSLTRKLAKKNEDKYSPPSMEQAIGRTERDGTGKANVVSFPFDKGN